MSLFDKQKIIFAINGLTSLYNIPEQDIIISCLNSLNTNVYNITGYYIPDLNTELYQKSLQELKYQLFKGYINRIKETQYDLTSLILNDIFRIYQPYIAHSFDIYMSGRIIGGNGETSTGAPPPPPPPPGPMLNIPMGQLPLFPFPIQNKELENELRSYIYPTRKTIQFKSTPTPTTKLEMPDELTPEEKTIVPHINILNDISKLPLHLGIYQATNPGKTLLDFYKYQIQKYKEEKAQADQLQKTIAALQEEYKQKIAFYTTFINNIDSTYISILKILVNHTYLLDDEIITSFIEIFVTDINNESIKKEIEKISLTDYKVSKKIIPILILRLPLRRYFNSFTIPLDTTLSREAIEKIYKEQARIIRFLLELYTLLTNPTDNSDNIELQKIKIEKAISEIKILNTEYKKIYNEYVQLFTKKYTRDIQKLMTENINKRLSILRNIQTIYELNKKVDAIYKALKVQFNAS